MAPKVCRKTHEDLFLRPHQKQVIIILAGEILLANVAQKPFRACLGKFRKRSFAPKKFVCCYTNHEKGTSDPIALVLKGQRGKYPAMPPFSGVPMHIILHTLSLLVVGYNVSL